MKYVKKYYLPWLVVFIIMFGISECSYSIKEGFDDSFENLGFLFSLISILTILCGTLVLLTDKYWGPYTQRKYLTKSPFIDLEKLGFTRIGNEYIGEIENYTIIIGYKWFGEGLHQCIYIKALFKSTEEHKLFDFKVFDYLLKKYKEEKVRWEINSATIKIFFNFKRPRIDKLKSNIDILINAFKEEELDRLTLKQYQDFDLSKYKIPERNDNPSTNRAKNLETLPKKHWYIRFSFIILIIGGILSLYSMHIYRVTLISWKLLFIPPFIGLILTNILSINLVRKARKKADMIIMNIVFGVLFGYSFFLLSNYYYHTKDFRSIEVEIKEIKQTSDGDVFIDVANAEFKKELVLTKNELAVIGQSNILYLTIEKGGFGYWIIRNISLQ